MAVETIDDLGARGTVVGSDVVILGVGGVLKQSTVAEILKEVSVSNVGSLTVSGNATISGSSTLAAISGTTLALSGVMTMSIGTAALPAIAISGSLTSGIFSPAADTWALSILGAEAFRIDINKKMDLRQGLTGILTNSTSLPTSDPGLAGQLWNNSGVVTVS